MSVSAKLPPNSIPKPMFLWFLAIFLAVYACNARPIALEGRHFADVAIATPRALGAFFFVADAVLLGKSRAPALPGKCVCSSGV